MYYLLPRLIFHKQFLKPNPVIKYVKKNGNSLSGILAAEIIFYYF